MVEASVLNATNTSLTLKLPPVKTNLTWHGITTPTSTYLVYYMEANRANSSDRKRNMLVSLKLAAFVFIRCSFLM